MRSLSLIGIMVLLALFISCIQVDDATTSPLEPDFQTGKYGQDYTEICRANMRTIAGQQTIYFAGHNTYSNSLEDLGLAGLSCAECGLEYILAGNDASYSIFCPAPLNRNHGNIIDGIQSWRNPPSYECYDNMMFLMIAQGYFYSEHGRYANSIEELEQSSIKCPECDYSYIVSGNETEYTISCPLPYDPTHGQVLNGVPSWFEPGHSGCREIMRTIAGQETIYFAGNACYTNSLEDLGMVGACCFECGLPYLLTATDSTYAIYCPLPQDPDHGNIINGIPSWLTP